VISITPIRMAGGSSKVICSPQSRQSSNWGYGSYMFIGGGVVLLIVIIVVVLLVLR
jgi:hypothetical protein